MTPEPGVLSTARLTLRPAAPRDAETLLAMHAASSPADATREQRVRALLERNAGDFAALGFGLWMLDEGARTLGYVGLRPRESAREPELYYGLEPAARGRGLATEAVRAVIDRLLAARGTTGVWAVTDPPNLASCRVLERIGMALEFEGEFDGKPSRVYRLRRADIATRLR